MSNEEISNLDGAVQELILAQSWEEATEVLKRCPILIGPYGEQALEGNLSIQADANVKAAIRQRLQLLRHARNIGPEAALRLVGSIDQIITVELRRTFHEIVSLFLESRTADEICQVLKRFPESFARHPRCTAEREA